MNDPAWIDAALTCARPQAIAALLRYFRDLDLAEEAFQEACLRALKNWTQNGPPRDPAAWLILVGRNAALDQTRRRAKLAPLPADDVLSDLEDAEPQMIERLDNDDYRDDLLRLLFVCCHPQLPATQQIALALRIVSGLSVKQIARAFLVGESAMEQRITRAKALVAAANLPFETPGAPERSERLAAVATMIYLLFNEGYSGTGESARMRFSLCDEAIRLGRLLLRLFQSEPEVIGLTALMLLQHARSAARLDQHGQIVLLEDQDRRRWNHSLTGEGLALLDNALRHTRPGAYQVQAAIAALHARAPSFEATDWLQIELLYASLERLQPSPVVSLNRAVALSKVQGPTAALALLTPLADSLSGYFYFQGVRGALQRDSGQPQAARESFNRAIALAGTAAEAAHIRLQLDRLMSDRLARPSLLAEKTRRPTMRFMMLMIPQGYAAAKPDARPDAAHVAEMMKYNEALKNAGVLLALDGLHPPACGARVSFKSCKAIITDGPFTESKEVLGGYWMIQVSSKQEALDWAARCPGRDDEVIEVRQVFEMGDFPLDVQKAAGDLSPPKG